MANDNKRADDLIDAMGQIDDRFVHEAENVTPFTFAGYRKRKRRLIPILAAAALSCALMLAGVFAILTPPAGSPSGAGNPALTGGANEQAVTSGGAKVTLPDTDGTLASPDASVNSAPEPTDSYRGDPLEITLLSLRAEELSGCIADGNEPFLDGVCRLVWSYGDGSYYAVSVTGRDDLRRLGDYLTDPDSIVPADETADNGIRFWICTGDGLSATPYLLYGAWGVGNLFEYNPESLPSSDFASFLADLIHNLT